MTNRLYRAHDSNCGGLLQQYRSKALVFSPVPMRKGNKELASERPAKGATNPPLRIVSLAPSATSILCAIGAKKALIGVTQWCAEVADVSGLPQLGD